jgi:type IV fimbrial biogenesis protein FimT
MKPSKGFTFIELVCTTAIATILFSISAPNLTALLESSRSQNLYDHLFTLIQYSRSKAAFLSEDVILCPSFDEKNCINDWQQPLIIFADVNQNRQRDFNEKIDKKVTLINTKANIKLTWRASGSSRYLRYVSDGSTGSQNGSFRICPTSKTLANIKKIIIFRSGRAREAKRKEIRAGDC